MLEGRRAVLGPDAFHATCLQSRVINSVGRDGGGLSEGHGLHWEGRTGSREPQAKGISWACSPCVGYQRATVLSAGTCLFSTTKEQKQCAFSAP